MSEMQEAPTESSLDDSDWYNLEVEPFMTYATSYYGTGAHHVNSFRTLRSSPGVDRRTEATGATNTYS